MEVTCPNCNEVTSLMQGYQYHAGFSNRGFLYCDACPTILKFGVYNPGYVAIVGNKHPWTLDRNEKRQVESALRHCGCADGGRFRFGALPRCPQCNAQLTDLLSDDIHFVEIGAVIDGDKEDVWK